MTVEIEYNCPFKITNIGAWQVKMAKQIKADTGIPIGDIQRELSGSDFTVKIDTTLTDSEIEGVHTIINGYLPQTATRK